MGYAGRDWMTEAACLRVPAEDMFPDPKDHEAQAHAQRICFTCTVIEPCDTYRHAINATHGIWAGEFVNKERGFTLASTARQKECGTPAAYRRHLRNNEKPCGRCAEAYNRNRATRRAQG